MSSDDSAATVRDTSPGLTRRSVIILIFVLAIAAGLRFWGLSWLSFWYDEVVTMRLAQAPTPRDLIGRLMEIDATRAPLHPLLLQGWIHLFGAS